ncbi:MAG: winged helix DNA-binding domain-containing protein [Spirochaetes bacterium]|nr:winged helix DNA-binding domain-containing protein [Spirochaetota bacterium]
METISFSLANHFLLTKQHLLDSYKIENIQQMLSDIIGLHATLATTPYLSLLARMPDFQKDQLYTCLYIEKSIAKIKCMRNTIHILNQKDISYIFQATSGATTPHHKALLDYLNFTEKQMQSLITDISTLLKANPLTAKEIKKSLPKIEKITHVLNLMGDLGLLVRGEPEGSWKSNTHRYYLWQDFFPHIDLESYSVEEAKIKLILKYIQAFGPVTMEDICWWMRTNKTSVKKVIQQHKKNIIEIKVDNEVDTFYMIQSEYHKLLDMEETDSEEIIILPVLDPYIMGYKKRKRFVSPDLLDFLYDRGGNGTSTIFYRGKIIGVWDKDEKSKKMKVYYFTKQTKKIEEMVIQKLLTWSDFIFGKTVEIQFCQQMIPFSLRTMGSFMSPLKEQ